MATAKAVLKTDYKSKDETYPLKIRLQQNNLIKYYNTGYKLTKKQLINGVVKRHPDTDVINNIISDLLNKAKKYFADCAINGRPVNLDKIFIKTTSTNFADYLLHRAGQYKEKGKIIMWQKLSRYEKELNECFDNKLFLDEVNADSLRTLESYLVKNGNHANTISKKFKILGQMFQAAVNEGLHSGVNHFKQYKIQTYPARKEKLSLDEIKAIEELELTGPYHDARNLFLFAYFLPGLTTF